MVSAHCWGQDRARATVEFQKGSEALTQGKAEKAAKLFRKATKLDKDFIPAYRLLGLAEETAGNYGEAAESYEYVLERDSLFSRLLYYQLGKVYYKLSRPEEAEIYLNIFKDLQSVPLVKFGRNGDEERRAEATALLKLDQDILAAQITQDSSQFVNVTEVRNVDVPINTMRDDYFPFFANDRKSFYYTRQGELRDEDLIQGKRSSEDGKWTTNRFGNFNTLQPEGMCTLVRDGERIYFTLCHEETSQGGCDIYSALLVNGKVRDMQPLPDYINSPSWESQPAISCDGQQLFFASIRPGGMGGSDIYRCQKNPDGTWSPPTNLGDGINTTQDEEGPFLSNDGQTLFFASMGHNSLGDQDIFMSRWDNLTKRFTRAMNIGPPVNGPHRELGFHLTSDGRTGYFASDRPGGRGGLDIYQFELDAALTGRDITYVSGYVTDSLTGEPVTEQAVVLPSGKTYYTNYEGRFFICSPANEELDLTVSNPAYFPYARTFPIPTWDNTEYYRIDVKLRSENTPPPPPPEVAPEPVVEEPEPEPEEEVETETIRTKARIVKRNMTVRFEFDDASLLPLQVQNINKFVESIKDKPLVSIEVIGFTDETGPEGYNIKLSEQRAQAVADLLDRAGVTATETRIIGMGELASTGRRALNRKVEVKVVYREQVSVE
ncbi:hypothetical protein A3850_018275 [Lewinella sp. 4G2]|nr:hypothetical protein A3850_018275 [Lewinella sp. 4G2]